MLREMLRLVLRAMLRSVANAGASDVASHGANRVAFNVANFAASDVALHDYHLVANPVLTVLPTTLRTFLLRMLPRVVTTLLRSRC